MATEFSYPSFWSYPPYFTLQPISETREKQVSSWTDLILQYCRAKKKFMISIDQEDKSQEDYFEPFRNEAVDRELPVPARAVMLQRLVDEGRGQWLDGDKRICIIWWRNLDDWAEDVQRWVKVHYSFY